AQSQDFFHSSNLYTIRDLLTAPELKLVFGRFVHEENTRSDILVYLHGTLAIDPTECAALAAAPSIVAKEQYLTANLSTITRSTDTTTTENKQALARNIFLINQCMEGTQFVSLWASLFSLAAQNKLPGTGKILSKLHQDTAYRIALFNKLLYEMREENPDVWTPAFQQELSTHMTACVKLEQDLISTLPVADAGLDPDTLSTYIEYLADHRLSACGLPLQFHHASSPFPWLDEQIHLDAAQRCQSQRFLRAVVGDKIGRGDHDALLGFKKGAEYGGINRIILHVGAGRRHLNTALPVCAHGWKIHFKIRIQTFGETPVSLEYCPISQNAGALLHKTQIDPAIVGAVRPKVSAFNIASAGPDGVAIDDDDFAVVAQIHIAAQWPVQHRDKPGDVAACLCQRSQALLGQGERANAVQQQADFDALSGFLRQNAQDFLTNAVWRQNEHGDVDAVVGVLKHRHEIAPCFAAISMKNHTMAVTGGRNAKRNQQGVQWVMAGVWRVGKIHFPFAIQQMPDFSLTEKKIQRDTDKGRQQNNQQPSHGRRRHARVAQNSRYQQQRQKRAEYRRQVKNDGRQESIDVCGACHVC
ncbi:MAG: hypothetical protein DSZ33_04645, partial [Gammaproteobacteria bacterium]